MIKAVIFDYGFTMSSDNYFKIPHPSISNWKEIVQRIAFDSKDINHEWMKGNVSLYDIARLIHDETNIPAEDIHYYLQIGCKNLIENDPVLNFAKELKKNSIPIGMVTINMDVFNDIIIPTHNYNQLFNIIVNSCDYNTLDKTKLWPIAFNNLGENIDYDSCLLIEDKIKEIQKFKHLGGYVLQYSKDATFSEELKNYSKQIYKKNPLH